MNTLSITPAARAVPGPPAVAMALATVYVLWGSTYLAIRFALPGYPPFLLGAIRMFLAGAIMYIVLRRRAATEREAVAHAGGAVDLHGAAVERAGESRRDAGQFGHCCDRGRLDATVRRRVRDAARAASVDGRMGRAGAGFFRRDLAQRGQCAVGFDARPGVPRHRAVGVGLGIGLES